MNNKIQVWGAYAKELGAFAFWNYLYQRFIVRRKILSIQVSGLYEPVYIRNLPSDHAMFTQLFIRKEYGKKIARPVSRIIDCGANIGLAALYFLRQYPAAAVTCIEPDAGNFFILEMNTRPYPNVKCINKAVWNKAGRLGIHGQSRGAAGLMVQEVAEKNREDVDAIPLSAVICENDQVDILKIDIEGSELQVLLADDISWIKNVAGMWVEMHEDIHPGITLRIRERYEKDFLIYRQGEYHVFERRSLS